MTQRLRIAGGESLICPQFTPLGKITPVYEHTKCTIALDRRYFVECSFYMLKIRNYEEYYSYSSVKVLLISYFIFILQMSNII